MSLIIAFFSFQKLHLEVMQLGYLGPHPHLLLVNFLNEGAFGQQPVQGWKLGDPGGSLSAQNIPAVLC